ncbi:unnamed protein product, partial [Prorocentrum cordatum]
LLLPLLPLLLPPLSRPCQGRGGGQPSAAPQGGGGRARAARAEQEERPRDAPRPRPARAAAHAAPRAGRRPRRGGHRRGRCAGQADPRIQDHVHGRDSWRRREEGREEFRRHRARHWRGRGDRQEVLEHEGPRPGALHVHGRRGWRDPGWDQGCLGMHVGEQRKLVIPAEEGYGKGGFPAWGIPPGGTLEFTLECLTIK